MHSKKPLLSIFDPRSPIVRSVFDCRLSGVWIEDFINLLMFQRKMIIVVNKHWRVYPSGHFLLNLY